MPRQLLSAVVQAAREYKLQLEDLLKLVEEQAGAMEQKVTPSCHPLHRCRKQEMRHAKGEHGAAGGGSE